MWQLLCLLEPALPSLGAHRGHQSQLRVLLWAWPVWPQPRPMCSENTVSLYMGFFKQVQVFICCINKPWKDLPELRQDWFENKTQPRMTTCMVPSLAAQVSTI